MICPNCRKQLPDNAEACSYCGARIDHKKQVTHEIKFRRYQRWVMYVIFTLLILGMIAVIVKIYSTNTQLIENITKAQAELDIARKNIEAKDNELSQVKSNLTGKEEELKQYLSELQTKNSELNVKTEELRTVLSEKIDLTNNYSQCQLNLDSADANIYNLIIKLGTGISNDNLNRIKLADANMVGADSDGDGLPDSIESAIGTDLNNQDTDGDGFGDKIEALGGFNPNGGGNLPIDEGFANSLKGRIMLQVEHEGEAWYIGSSDGKKYYLGKPADAFRIMRDLEYWSMK